MKRTKTSWSGVRLSVKQRKALRDAILRHPDSARVARSVDQLIEMRKNDLIDAATRIGIDVDALLTNPPPDRLVEEMVARILSGGKKYAFNGTIPFDLEIRALGASAVHKARATYSNTPGWAHIDLSTGREVLDHEDSSVAFEVFDIGEKGANTWSEVPLLAEHLVLADAVWETLDEKIDADFRRQDRDRRTKLRPKLVRTRSERG